MRHKEESAESVGKLLEILKPQVDLKNDTVWFRGHAKNEWNLVPTLYRDGFDLNHEQTLIRRFRQNAPPYLQHRPTSWCEWLFLMRHYGCPTRILDWSESPLIALFFACAEPEYDGNIWCLDPIALNDLSGITKEHATDIPMFEEGNLLDDFSPERIQTRLSPRDSKPIAALAPREPGRMASQLGVLTIHQRPKDAIESIATCDHAWSVRIPKEYKPLILEELSVLGVGLLSIYPGLDSVAKIAKGSIR